MHKTAVINARIDPDLKEEAEIIIHKVGLTTAEAIRLFYSQICLHHGLPFEVKIPSAKTRQALEDVKKGKTLKAKSVRDLFQEFD